MKFDLHLQLLPFDCMNFPWFSALTEPNAKALHRVYEEVSAALPSGFEEKHNAAGVHWVVPFSTYPPGYHCPPTQPLPFISLLGQKNHLALYHLGMYSSPDLSQEVTQRLFNELQKKPDLGKGCIRMKWGSPLPIQTLQWLAVQQSPEAWIRMYEVNILKK